MNSRTLSIYNCRSADLAALPRLQTAEFRETVIGAVQGGGRIASFFGLPGGHNTVTLIAVIADDHQGLLHLTSCDVLGSYPSLTPDCPQAHWFEREIYEQHHVCPTGHPWLKPVRFCSDGQPIGVTDYFRVQGDEIHEVAVGPVHAGIIEPGHFRFQCNGENVLHLEISLGYQHRGIESRLAGQLDNKAIHYMETAAGDTTVGHTTAYCHITEALTKCPVPARAHALRGIALELERLANHTGDLGALAGDVGYLPTASFCGRIRGDFLNMTAILCGNRFGRGFVRPGGVGFDLENGHIDQVRSRLAAAIKDVANAADCLFTTPSVLSRFDGTGTLSGKTALELGLVGPAARASGMSMDDRFNFAAGIFQFKQIPVATWDSGDVFSRAYVRWLEMQHSVAFINDLLETMPAGAICATLPSCEPNRIAVALVEGWRGEICHAALTDAAGRLSGYKVVDPSFHNWMGLAVAMRNQQISDFPLCNKSFNLSYCGHDL